jgi:hypothetical protein
MISDPNRFGQGSACVACHAQAVTAGYAKASWRQKLPAACAAHAGLCPASLVLYDVCPPSISRLIPATGSATGGSPRNGGSRKSPSAC